MDEIKYVCVPYETVTTYQAAEIRSAPTTHVAAKRETIRKCMALAYDAGQSAIAIELGNLLSQKGE